MSVSFVRGRRRGNDGAFLFVYGIESVTDVGSYFVAPFPTLLLTPLVFVAGAAALVAERYGLSPGESRAE